MFQFDSHILNQHASFQPEIFDSWSMDLWRSKGKLSKRLSRHFLSA